jgi:hypothetical protein
MWHHYVFDRAINTTGLPIQIRRQSWRTLTSRSSRTRSLTSTLKGDGGRGGKPVPTHESTAEQVREAKERAEARDAEASNRDRMVDIGRGNQQTGRQGS